ncbi:MAG: Lipoprotein LpqB, beta-propeller domain-like protein [Mycobacterium sp.]|nr:Lipoprotein LpqB, beta-propeller domain-like protein [Mycobacterium sp.]
MRSGLGYAARRYAALAVALVLPLAACAGVPDGGAPVSVRTVPPAGSVQDEPDVRIQPPGPVAGSSPVRVVRGFLNAAVSSDDRHAVARTFLGAEAARAWPDDGPVRVFRLASVTSAGPDTVRVRGRTVGVVGTDGAFTSSDRPLDLLLRLRWTGSVWQLVAPPPGVYLQDVYFTQVYIPYSVYFVAAGSRRVVPDLRYLDRSLGNAEPSRLVRLLLAGPSSWLAPGVRTAFPPGTRLRGNAVRDDDVLTVDLTAEADFASPDDRAMLSAQLVWTLRQFQVNAVRIEVEGRRFDAPGVGDVQAVDRWQHLNPAAPAPDLPAYQVRGGAVRVLVPSPGSPIPPGAPFGGAQARSGTLSAAVSLDGSALALVKAGRGGQRLYVGPSAGPLPARYVAARLGRPTWGPRTSAVLVVADGTRLLLVPQTGPIREVAAPGLRPYLARGRAVVAIRLAPDGIRLALVVGTGPDAELLTGVLCGEDTRAPSLVALRSVATGLTDLTDVGWSRERALVTVGRETGGELLPWELSSDGSTRSSSSRSGLPAGPLGQLAATPGDHVLVGAGGTTYQRFFNSWGAPLSEDVVGAEPFYPG